MGSHQRSPRPRRHRPGAAAVRDAARGRHPPGPPPRSRWPAVGRTPGWRPVRAARPPPRATSRCLARPGRRVRARARSPTPALVDRDHVAFLRAARDRRSAPGRASRANTSGRRRDARPAGRRAARGIRGPDNAVRMMKGMRIGKWEAAVTPRPETAGECSSPNPVRSLHPGRAGWRRGVPGRPAWRWPLRLGPSPRRRMRPDARWRPDGSRRHRRPTGRPEPAPHEVRGPGARRHPRAPPPDRRAAARPEGRRGGRPAAPRAWMAWSDHRLAARAPTSRDPERSTVATDRRSACRPAGRWRRVPRGPAEEPTAARGPSVQRVHDG